MAWITISPEVFVGEPEEYSINSNLVIRYDKDGVYTAAKHYFFKPGWEAERVGDGLRFIIKPGEAAYKCPHISERHKAYMTREKLIEMFNRSECPCFRSNTSS